MRGMPGKRPIEIEVDDDDDDEDAEDLSGPSESDPEADGAAIDMLLVGPSKDSMSAPEADPQAVVSEFEATLDKLKQLVAKMG